VHAHLREVFLGGTTKALFLDHLDRRININKNQADNLFPSHDQTFVG